MQSTKAHTPTSAPPVRAGDLDLLRSRNLTSHQLMLLAKQTGSALVAAEADAQAVVERLRKGPRQVAYDPEAIDAAEAARILTAAFREGRAARLGARS